MKSIVFVAAALAATAPSSGIAATSRSDQMLKLAPETRLEQRCNARAMGAIGREHRSFKPDEFVAYAFGETVIRGAQIKAPGGALRSAGHWYHVSYVCETSADGMEIRSFSYALGDMVPRKDWDAHFLVP
ncbi:MAG TPA: DUF930 domain-containing protein [Tardiphaga sp.]